MIGIGWFLFCFVQFGIMLSSRSTMYRSCSSVAFASFALMSLRSMARLLSIVGCCTEISCVSSGISSGSTGIRTCSSTDTVDEKNTYWHYTSLT